MSNIISIGSRQIFRNCAPYIVAEAGINHNGELSKALEMVDVALNCGVDAIKFQTFTAEEFVLSEKQLFTYTSQDKEVTESMLKMFKRYEFTKDEWIEIKQYCDKKGITFLSTPQNTSDLELLLDIGLEAIKVGSDDFTNLPLLKEYSKTGLPMIISSGMANLSEIYEALDTIGSFDGYPTILLQCTSAYPTPPSEVNMNKMKSLFGAFPDLLIGFSDHTQGSLASSLAVAMGACFFEKHFTLSHDLPGPDHWFSEDPKGLRNWFESINLAYKMLGSGIIRPTKTEIKNKKEFSRYLVAKDEIKKGEVFGYSNVTYRRLSSGAGIPAKLLDFLSSNRVTAKRNYKANEKICL